MQETFEEHMKKIKKNNPEVFRLLTSDLPGERKMQIGTEYDRLFSENDQPKLLKTFGTMGTVAFCVFGIASMSGLPLVSGLTMAVTGSILFQASGMILKKAVMDKERAQFLNMVYEENNNLNYFEKMRAVGQKNKESAAPEVSRTNGKPSAEMTAAVARELKTRAGSR